MLQLRLVVCVCAFVMFWALVLVLFLLDCFDVCIDFGWVSLEVLFLFGLDRDGFVVCVCVCCAFVGMVVVIVWICVWFWSWSLLPNAMSRSMSCDSP